MRGLANMRFAVALILLWIGCPSWALDPIESVRATPQGIYVNGEPFFPVGVGHAAHWHHRWKKAAETGFNCVTTCGKTPEDFRRDIDYSYVWGMYSVCYLGNGVWKDRELTREIILACRRAPGLLAWELEDEPNSGAGPNNDAGPYQYPPEILMDTYRMIKRLDPKHPVVVNLMHGAPQAYQDYAVCSDIQSGDIYPVEGHTPNTVPPENMAAVGRYVDAIKSAGETPWIWLQMSSMTDTTRRPPNITEVRSMTEIALAHGATAIRYLAFHINGWNVYDDPELWQDWKDFIAELQREQ